MRIALSLLAGIGILCFGETSAAAATCPENVNIAVAQMVCETDDESGSSPAQASGAGPSYSYSYISRCKAGEGCVRTDRLCRTSDGGVGAWYIVRRTNLDTGEVENLGAICMEPREEDRDIITITPAMVRREMQRLDWPTAQLEVQPPDGQTLINFDTNFFTDNTDPTTQTVTLLGQRVEIEATPSEYTWDFGDGTSRSTTSPGAAYPALDVTHEYADPGRVSPSVATTYQGRYRINGGTWQPIPGSLTLDGEPESLRVRSASPRLVGSY